MHAPGGLNQNFRLQAGGCRVCAMALERLPHLISLRDDGPLEKALDVFHLTDLEFVAANTNVSGSDAPGG